MKGQKNIKPYYYLACVTSFLNCINQQNKALPVILNIRGKTTFITDIASILPVFSLDYSLQGVVDCCIDENFALFN